MDHRTRDREIAKSVQAGERDRFEMFVYFYEKPLFNFILGQKLEREAAADVTQEAFLKAYRSIDTFDPERSSFKTWLYTIAFNACRDFGRRQAVRLRGLKAMVRRSEADPSAAGAAARIERKDQVDRLLAHIDTETRKIIEMKFLQDLPYEAITAITGMPRNTIRSKIYRGLKRLQAIWAGEDGESQ